MADDARYLSIPKAAKACGVSRATMWNWVKSGKIAAFVTPGGHHRIRREVMDRFVSEYGFSGEKASTPDHILVVDDDPAVRKIFLQRLGRQGYHVEVASNGFEAGMIIYQRKPDLVLLDLFMEGVDGFEVCRTIKNDPTLNHIKVLALSGVDDAKIQQRIFKEGADDFVAKSTDFGAVLDKIKELLERRDGNRRHLIQPH